MELKDSVVVFALGLGDLYCELVVKAFVEGVLDIEVEGLDFGFEYFWGSVCGVCSGILSIVTDGVVLFVFLVEILFKAFTLVFLSYFSNILDKLFFIFEFFAWFTTSKHLSIAKLL